MTLLRSLLFNIVYFGVSFALSLYGALFCRTPDSALAIGQLWARVCLGAARRICGITLEVTGREYLPREGAALIGSQHQSAFDTMVWQVLLPRVSYVAKLELTRLPLFGKLTMLSGTIPVDRNGGAAAIRALMKAADRAKADRRQIIIFPEGTRAMPGVHVPLHPGIAAVAHRTGLPVIPVQTDSGLLWGRRSFIKRAGTIHMRILPPLPANLPRGEVMRQLDAALHPVDNSVGSVSAEFPRDSSLLPQVPVV